MNDKDTQNEQLENILKRAHVPGPSPELKERITAETTKAWNQTSPELSWQISVRRLIVSAAAAVFVIWLTNCTSDYAVARWRSGGPTVANQELPNLDVLPEIPYRPLIRRLVSTGRKPSITDASALRSYAETMLLILDEAQQNGASKPPSAVEGRSILLRKKSGLKMYS
jgi:hypothetical protein